MFGLFKKDPVKTLENEYMQKMEEARDLQRAGDIQAYALKVAEAEKLGERLDAMRTA
ncbi:MAG: DUF6435 family protein [Acidobacteriota bacterium]